MPWETEGRAAERRRRPLGETRNPQTQSGLFDLNIQKILEHWGLPEATREVIANALDEAALSDTRFPQIVKRQDSWHIIDFGRGLRYQHLTQNESKEKLARSDKVVGKFGIGLKDALATFDRRGVGLKILSPHAEIGMQLAPKDGFADVKTLHAVVSPSSQPRRKGTEFVLRGLKDSDMEAAKAYFLRFSKDKLIETTSVGSIHRRSKDVARIYVKGLRVNTEEGFLFSYNITKTTTQLQRSLNRERNNVGRTAYQDRVKKILLSSRSTEVAKALVDDLGRLERGTQHEETNWLDVQEHAVRLLATDTKVVFVSAQQMYMHGESIQQARFDGYRVQVIPERLLDRIKHLRDMNGNRLVDISGYIQIFNQSFQYEWVEPGQLNDDELRAWALLPELMELASEHAKNVKEVRISKTLRIDEQMTETEGVWDKPNVVIKRSVLDTPRHFAKVFLHEIGHSDSFGGHGSLNYMDAIDDMSAIGALTALGKEGLLSTQPKPRPESAEVVAAGRGEDRRKKTKTG